MNTCSVSGQSCVFEWGSRLLFYYQMPIPHRHHAPDGLEGLMATLGRERRQSYREADFCCFLASRCRRRDGYWPRQDEKLREGEMVALVVDRSWPMTLTLKRPMHPDGGGGYVEYKNGKDGRWA